LALFPENRSTLWYQIRSASPEQADLYGPADSDGSRALITDACSIRTVRVQEK
jgi:hypothetical protein